jgi:hypothetical protein
MINLETNVVRLEGTADKKYLHSIKLSQSVVVNASATIRVKVWIAKSLEDQSEIWTYRGYNGNNYSSMDNPHPDLFEVKKDDKCKTLTSVNEGQIPGLMYKILQ